MAGSHTILLYHILCLWAGRCPLPPKAPSPQPDSSWPSIARSVHHSQAAAPFPHHAQKCVCCYRGWLSTAAKNHQGISKLHSWDNFTAFLVISLLDLNPVGLSQDPPHLSRLARSAEIKRECCETWIISLIKLQGTGSMTRKPLLEKTNCVLTSTSLPAW